MLTPSIGPRLSLLLGLVAAVLSAPRDAFAANEYDCGPGGKPNKTAKKCECPAGKVEQMVKEVSKCVDAPKPKAKTCLKDDDVKDCIRLCDIEKSAVGCTRAAHWAASLDQWHVATAYWLKACDLGDSSSCDIVGEAFRSGDGVSKDAAKSEAFFKKGFVLDQKACDQGDKIACRLLGKRYDVGKGVAQDESKALSKWTDVCDGGDSDGCKAAGTLCRDGKGSVPKDKAKALALFKKGCALKDSSCCDEAKKLEAEK